MRYPTTRALSKPDNLTHHGFWLDTVDPIGPAEKLMGTHRCDIAIIGGGFAGLSTAYHASQLMPGANIRVVESGLCGSGASGRCGGFCTSLFGMNKEMTSLRFGPSKTLEAHHYMEDAVDFVANFVETHNIDCDLERVGTLLVATTPSQVNRINKEIELARKWQLDGIERWTKERLAHEFPVSRFHQGMFNSKNVLLNPARFVQGLLALVRSSGVQVYEHSPVLSVQEEPGAARVRCKEGQLLADRVVFATNAFSSAFSQVATKQTPVMNHAIVTEPLTPDQLKSIGWGSRCGFDDAQNMLHYCRLTADNRILLGGGDITPVYGTQIPRAARQASLTHLKKHLTTLFPPLAQVAVTHQWSGPVSISVDLAPTLGYVGKRKAIFATGLSGHGVSMAPYNGLCIAELLAGEKSKRTEMFFVDRTALPWPPNLIRFPLLHATRALLRCEDALRWR